MQLKCSSHEQAKFKLNLISSPVLVSHLTSSSFHVQPSAWGRISLALGTKEHQRTSLQPEPHLQIPGPHDSVHRTAAFSHYTRRGMKRSVVTLPSKKHSWHRREALPHSEFCSPQVGLRPTRTWSQAPNLAGWVNAWTVRLLSRTVRMTPMNVQCAFICTYKYVYIYIYI